MKDLTYITLFVLAFGWLFALQRSSTRKGAMPEKSNTQGWVVDTSALMDVDFLRLMRWLGSENGFLLIPSNVLNELKSHADNLNQKYTAQQKIAKEVLAILAEMQNLEYDDEFNTQDADEQSLLLSIKHSKTLVSSDAALLNVAKVKGVSTLSPRLLRTHFRQPLQVGIVLDVLLVHKSAVRNQMIGVSSEGIWLLVNDGAKFAKKTRQVTVTKPATDQSLAEATLRHI